MNEETKMIPYYVHESDMARLEKAHQTEMERVGKDKVRWFATWLITFAMLVGGVIFYFWHENQFTTEENTITQDVDTGDGGLTLTGIGDIYYGESPTDYKDTQESP